MSFFTKNPNGQTMTPSSPSPTRTTHTQSPSMIITGTSGKQYSLDNNTVNWVKSRYKQDMAGSYGLDDADQLAKRNGQLSASALKTYKNSNVDRQLAELGLPSEKNLEKYLESYNQWHTGGMDQYFGQMNLPKNYWTNVKGWYQSDMQNAYENTAEDQQRKARGLMPSKWEAKYTDTEIDDQLRARGLPPISEFKTYAGRWDNYQGIENFYANVALNETNLRLAGVKDDSTIYPYNGEEYTGKDLYVKAFYDELNKKNDDGSYAYSAIRPMFKNSSTKETTPTGDFAYDEGAKVLAENKNAVSDEDYANYNAFSYDDYKSKYDDLYNRYFAGQTLSNGQTVNDALTVKAREEDAEALRDYFKSGVKEPAKFTAQYFAEHQDATPETMFLDMEANNVTDTEAYEVYETMKKEAKGTSAWYDVVNGWSKTYGGVWSNVNESDAPIPDTAKPLTDEQRDAQAEKDRVKAAQQYSRAMMNGDSDALAIASDRAKNLGYNSIEDMTVALKEAKSDEYVQAVKDAIAVYESAMAAYEDTYPGYGAPSAASREPIDKATAALNALGFKSVHDATRYVGGAREADPQKFVRENTAAMNDYVDNAPAPSEEAVTTARNAIEAALIDDNGPMYSSVDAVIRVLDGIAENSANSAAYRLALEDLGFTDLSGMADDLTADWSDADKRKLKYHLGGNNFLEMTDGEDSANNDWSAVGSAQYSQQLNYDKFSRSLEWVLQQVNAGKMTEADGYQLLAANGFQNEMEEYMGDEWHKAHFVENTAPGLYAQAEETDRLLWEEMTPEEQRAAAEDLWNDLSDEQKASMYGKDWWKFDPTVYRTFGQALEQQFQAVLPGLGAEIISTPVKVLDAIEANLSGRPDMWETTQDLMAFQQKMGNLGAVTDNVNGAGVAQTAADVVQEIGRMYFYGSIGGAIGAGFAGTSAGAAVLAGSASNSMAVRGASKMFMSMVKSSPFVVSAFANNYAEVKQLGANNKEATWFGLITGLSEGLLEGFEFDNLWGKVLGQKNFAATLALGKNTYLERLGIIGKAWISSAAVSGLGEFTEESIGYVLETFLKMRHSDTWGKGTDWSASDWLQQAMMGFITGALGGGIAAGGSFVSDGVKLANAMKNNPQLQASLPDILTGQGIANGLPEAAMATYRDGGAEVMSKENYGNTIDQIADDYTAIFNAANLLDKTKAEAKAEYDTKVNEINSTVSSAVAANVNDSGKLSDFVKKCKKLGISIDFDGIWNTDPQTWAAQIQERAQAAKQNALDNARAEYETAVAKAEADFEGNVKQKQRLLDNNRKKIQEHYVGLYLQNEDLINSLSDEMLDNLAQAYQNGARYEPGQQAERVNNAPEAVDEAATAEYNNGAGEPATSSETAATEESNAAPAPETFLTKEAISDAKNWAREKKWKIPELGFIGKASLAGSTIDLATLMRHPTIAAAEKKANSFKVSTFDQYNGLSNPERHQLRLNLVDTLFDNEHGSAVFEDGKLKKVNDKGVYNGKVDKGFRAAIIIGPPAAGKSTVFADPLSQNMKARIMDSDIIKALLPEFDDGWGAGRVNKESTYITKAAIERALTDGDEHYGDNIIIPKVGDDASSIIELAEQLKAAGYTVDLYLNDVPSGTSIMRAMARFGKEGRYLSTGFLNSIGDKPLNVFKEIANRSDLFNYAEWRDNNVRIDQEPILRWKTGDGEFPADRTTQSADGRGSVGEAGQLRETDAGGGGTEQRGEAVGEGAGERVSGTRKTASRFDAAVNGSKVLSENERTKIAEHVKRVGFKGALSFINDPDQVFDGKIENGDITLNLAYITAKDAKELKDNPGFWVLKHEFTHFIENTKYYGNFFNAVRTQMESELGEDGFVKAKQAYADAAEKAGHPFEDEIALERDMVADYVGSQLFTSQKAIDSFVREQDDAASRVFNWLRYVIDRGKLRRQRNSSALKILQAERMYSQAFRAANKAPAKTSTDYSTPGIDYDLIKSQYGRDESGNYVGKANPTTGVTAEEDARYMQLVQEGKLDEAAQMVRDMFERNGWLHGYHAGRRNVGDYTRVKMSEFSGNQYFLAKNLDMSKAYTRFKNVKPIQFAAEMQMLSDFVTKINEQYGTDFRVEHQFLDANNGNILDGEALENAAPKDVRNSYLLVDNETGLTESDAPTAGRLARHIKETYDGYGLIDNPLEGGIYDLYLSSESANTHRGYNQPWAYLPSREVEDSFVATEVYIRDLPDGNQELVVTHESDPDNPVYYTVDGSKDSLEEAFDDAFGRATGWNAKSAYQVFLDHAREVDRNGEKVRLVNDMYYYPGDGPGEMDAGEYGALTTDEYGRSDANNWYDSTVIKNIYDYPDSDIYSKNNPKQKPGDVYIARSPRRIKSADAVTYDNKGNVIPLSLRGNQRVDDIRFSTPGLSWDEMLNQYGAIEPGRSPRARDVQVPKQTSDYNRVSQWIRSLIESGKLTDDQAQNVLRMVVEQDYGTYVPTSQAERMEEARAYIAERQPLQAQQEFHDMVMQGKFGVKTNALGLQLLSDASERGDFASVLDIASDLQLAATEAGQSAQIFNVLKELKGVGSAWYMQKVIDRMNAKYADRIKAGKMNRIAVDPALMAELAKATTVDQMAAAEEAVAKDIARQLPLTWDDRLSSWRYFSMLANPTTHIRNITGNLLMKGLNTAKDAVATGLENLLGIDQGDRAHAILSQADRNIWRDWVQQSYEEQARNLSGGSKLGFESFVKQNMRSFDNKFINALAQFNFKALENEDIAFIKPAYKNALMQYMVAQGYTLNEKGQAGKVDVKGKFREMSKAQMNEAIDWASQQAWKQTFRDASDLATMLNKLSKENAVSRLLVEGVMPFKKTPINIAKRGVDYSPAGIIKGIAQLTNGVKKGKVTTAQAIDTLSSGITGSALMALGVMLAKLGVIRAGGEKDKKLEAFLEDTGDQTYAVKFGDKSINMSSIAPATIPLFMGVALNEMIEQGGDTLDLSTITDTIAGTLNPFMEMSFMSSLNSALKNYNANGIGGALGSTLMTAAQNYGSQYLPTIGGKIAQFLDPTRRTTKSDITSPVGSNMDYYARSLAKKVPGLESTLQPDVDVWGRTDTKDSFGDWALDFANKFILPTNVKVTNRDAVDNELIRVVESTGVTDFLPSDGAKYFKVNKVTYEMNAKQYAQYSQDRGQAAYAALKDVMAGASYQRASDEEKAAMLKKALDAAYKQVSNQWKEKLGAYNK